MENKLVKKAVAFVIYNEDRSKFLVVQRPDDDEDLPNMWGLPAGSQKGGETWEDVVLRSGREKLGVELEVVELIGEDKLDRKEYILHMREYEAKIIKGVPEAPQNVEGVTQYKDCRWGTHEDIIEIAKRGSLCTRIYLSSIGKTWE